MTDTLHGKRNFANVTKLKILRWRSYPGRFIWKPNGITIVLLNKRGVKIFEDVTLRSLKMEIRAMS
jgi:hypothetical protein